MIVPSWIEGKSGGQCIWLVLPSRVLMAEAGAEADSAYGINEFIFCVVVSRSGH